MKIKVLNCRAKSFKNSDGDDQDYFWIKALRAIDQVTFTFGSNLSHEEGENLDLEIEKYERENGKIGYREITKTTK